jgi:c-di-GMP-related signal transduction protein
LDIFIARQPIFDDLQKVIAYELLFRDSSENKFNSSNQNAASIDVLNDLLIHIGYDKLIHNKPAFINFTYDLLLSDIVLLLDKEKVVIEILEDVKIDQKILNRCAELKKMGFKLALDDYIYKTGESELFKYIDILKVDFMDTTESERYEIVELVKDRGIKLLAEKVETYEEFKIAKECGFSYFQGFFFKKPEMIRGKKIPNNVALHFKIIAELNKEPCNFSKIEELSKKDSSIVHRILKLINSAAIAVRQEIKSLKQAFVLLGSENLYRWFLLLLVKDSKKNKPTELVINAVIRGFFCEELAMHDKSLKKRRSEAFILGCISLLDAVLDMRMEDILESLPIHKDIKDALLLKKNKFGELLKIVELYESANWRKLIKLLAKKDITEKQLFDIYLKSINKAYTVSF